MVTTITILYFLGCITDEKLIHRAKDSSYSKHMAKGKPMIEKLAAMRMTSDAPAIFRAQFGGFMYSPFSAVIFLSIGASAIFQVILTLIQAHLEGYDNCAHCIGGSKR